jgi:Domain of unknown function (DUF222)/HNH endonuclease
MFESDPPTAIEMANALSQVLSDRELLGRTDAVWTALGRAHLELLALLAEADRREAWRDQGAEDVCHWVSIRYGISMWKAARWVEAARSLPSLPLIAKALASGRLGIDHVVELCRFANPETEQRLIAWASERSSGAVRRRADLERLRSRNEVVQAERDRWLRSWTTVDGMHVGIEAQLPIDQGATVELALTRLAEHVPDRPDDVEPGARRAPSEVRRADALVQLCSGRLAADPDRERATVVAHVDARTLSADGSQLEAVPNAEVETGHVLAPATAQRLLCDARVQVSLDDAAGVPLTLGRATRTPSAAMVRALRRRDRTCRFPGCGRRRYTDAHHVIWWSRGGRTDLANLVLLCGFHHRLVHEGGWRLRLLGGAEVEWFLPGGQRYRAGPAPPGIH